MYKEWGIGDIVGNIETIPFTPADYDHIEAVEGDDPNNHITFNRIQRNLFENSQELFNFLEKLAKSTNNFTGIFKDSLEQAHNFVGGHDVFSISTGGTYETTTVQAIIPGGGLYDLGRTYFMINTSAGGEYYVWFDTENDFADPAVAQAEITEVTVEGTATAALLDGDYFIISSAGGTTYWVWFDVDNLSVAPVPGGGETLVEVDITTGWTPTQIATALNTKMDAEVDFISTINGTVVKVLDANTGTVADATNGTCGADLSASVLVQGDAIDGGVAGKTGLEVNLFLSDGINEIAAAIETVVDANVNFDVSSATDTATIINVVPGLVVDASDGAGGYATGFTIITTNQGSEDWKYYSRLTPGISYINDNIVVVRPQTHIAERQLIRAFNLEVWAESGEDCIINYDFATDKYDAVVYKRDTNDVLQTYTFNNGGPKYNTGLECLLDIYSHPVLHTAFEAAVTGDLMKVVLEPVGLIVGTGIKYWSLKNDGTLELRTVTIGAGGQDLWNFDVSVLGQPPTVISINDTRPFFQHFNDFDNNIYFNVPTSWEVDNTKELSDDQTKQFDPASVGVDWSKITDRSCFVTILKQHDGGSFSSTSANFGWVEGDVADLDPHAIPVSPGGPSDTFFMNKDLAVQWGIGGLEWARISDLALSIGGTVPSVSTYALLPGAATDGEIYLVRDVNQLYRYSTTLTTWIPISDPHKQYWGQVGTMTGDQADDWGGGPNGTEYTFSGLWWKTDGSNIQVFVNGHYQILGAIYDYEIDTQNKITFTYNLIAADKITVRVSEGGDEFYPERVAYMVGTAAGAYLGDLKEFPVYFELVRDRVDVYINGVMQKESPYSDSLTETGGANTDRIIDSSKTFTAANIGNWVFVTAATNTDNLYELRRVSSVPNATTLVLDVVLPQNTTVADTYQLFEDYDYFTDEYNDTIFFANDQANGDFVEVRDRSTIIGTLDLSNRGTVFPGNPIFGMEFLRSDLDEWFKWDGSTWQQIT